MTCAGGDGHADVAGGGGVPGMRQQHRAFGAKPLDQRAGGDARLGGDLAQRQLRGPAAVHHPHQCREHIYILCLATPWTHPCLTYSKHAFSFVAS